MIVTHLIEYPLFAIGVLLLAGFAMGKLVAYIHLPEISGFIIAGLLLGDSVAGLVSPEMSESMVTIAEIALGMIALTIGGEFAWKKIRRLSGNIVIITAIQLFASFVGVALGLSIFGFPLPLSLIMGTIASATAPAATVAIVQSMRLKGEFVDYLYGVVALDDAGAVVLFGLIGSVVSALIGNVDQAAVFIAIEAVGEVLLSVIVGIAGGIAMHLATVRQRGNRDGVLITTFGLLLLNIAIARVLHLSPLLVNMSAGATLINISNSNHTIFRSFQPITAPIYLLFFVIAGTELRLEIFAQPHILLLGMVYIVSRAIGKYGGVFLGSAIVKAPNAIRNYLGMCMLPQAGVALGLVIIIQSSFIPESANGELVKMIDTMVNVVLMSIFVNELIGPPLSRFALERGARGHV